MSTHIHAILWPHEGINLSDVTRDFKRFTSRRISKLAQQRDAKEVLSAFKNARKGNRAQAVSTYQVWQEGSHPEAIFTGKFARQTMNYTALGHKLRFFRKGKAQFVTVGIIYSHEPGKSRYYKDRR